MYTVYCDGNLLYDPRVEELQIFNKRLKLEVNTTGAFDFKIYPKHPMYNAINRLTSVIEVYQDNLRIFRGRVLDDEHDFYNAKNILCEGDLAFFNDSIIRPFEFQGSITEFLEWIIDEHNDQVTDAQKFTLGDVTVETSTNYVNRSSINAMSSWEVVNSRLLDLIGGFIMVRRKDGINYIDYLEDTNRRSLQEIELGKNLLDLNKNIKGQDIKTALIPYGARLKDEEGNETDERLTIESVNDGKDYVFNPDAVKKYGWIFGTHTWDDVTIEQNLLTRANQKLAEMMDLQVSIEVNAVDLSMTSDEFDKFRFFEYVKVDSPSHLLDDWMLISKLNIDLEDPANNTLTLGLDYATFTERQLETESAIKNIPTIKGPPGKDGEPTYTWVKYADTPTSGMSDYPEDKEYIGLAFNKKIATESTNYSDYDWSLLPQNIEIGGRNLLLNSENLTTTGTNAAGLSRSINDEGHLEVIASPGNRNYISNFGLNNSEAVRENLNTGDTFTFSIEMKSKDSTDIPDIYFGPGFGYSQLKGTMSPEFSKMTYTGVWTQASLTLVFHMGFRNRSGTFVMRKAKLEKGTIATDWTPAPEDMATNDYVTDVEISLSSNIELESDALRTEVSEKYTEKSEFTEYQETQETQYEQLSDSFNFTFTELIEQIDRLDGETKAQFEEIVKYIRFVDGNIILGEVGNEVTLRLTNNRIQFLQSGAEVAYFSDNMLYVTDVRILNSLLIGQFGFYPRANGSLDFK